MITNIFLLIFANQEILNLITGFTFIFGMLLLLKTFYNDYGGY